MLQDFFVSGHSIWIAHKGSTVTKVIKQQNWDAIRDRLNLDCPVAKKKKWKNFKPESKKEFNKYKKSLTETGMKPVFVYKRIITAGLNNVK